MNYFPDNLNMKLYQLLTILFTILVKEEMVKIFIVEFLLFIWVMTYVASTQRCGEGGWIVEALLETRRLENSGPVCRPAQVDFAVHRVRPLQRDVRSVLGSVAAHPFVGQGQRQVAPLPRPLCQRRNTRRWRKTGKHTIHILIYSFTVDSIRIEVLMKNISFNLNSI